jgi:hypothetical protein
MTLAEQIASDTSGVLLSADNLAQSITHQQPDGTVESVTGQVFFEALDAGMPDPTGERGTSVMSVAHLELAASVEVIEERPGGRPPSLFTIGSETWVAKRIVGKDDDSQTVEIHRVSRKATKRAAQ